MILLSDIEVGGFITTNEQVLPMFNNETMRVIGKNKNYVACLVTRRRWKEISIYDLNIYNMPKACHMKHMVLIREHQIAATTAAVDFNLKF